MLIIQPQISIQLSNEPQIILIFKHNDSELTDYKHNHDLLQLQPQLLKLINIVLSSLQYIIAIYKLFL